LEVKKGTLVLFLGNLMHKKAANKSEKDRVAYTFSIVEGSSTIPIDMYVRPKDGFFESLRRVSTYLCVPLSYSCFSLLVAYHYNPA